MTLVLLDRLISDLPVRPLIGEPAAVAPSAVGGAPGLPDPYLLTRMALSLP